MLHIGANTWMSGLSALNLRVCREFEIDFVGA